MATKEKKTTTREESQEQSTGMLSELAEGPELEEEVYSAEAFTEYAEQETEEADDVEDHDSVSSAETGEVEETADVEAPSVGENGSLAKGDGAGDEEAERMEAEPDLESELEILEGFDPSILEMTEADLMEGADENQLLDAYHLEFGDPVVNELLRQRPELYRSTHEVIIGKDDRVRVGNTRAYPWRCICQLTIELKTGHMAVGTGWLVGPRTVITAGHCVYMHDYGGWAKQITVRPGRNGSNPSSDAPFGSAVSSRFHSVKGWTQNKKRSHDYGAIILPKDAAFGKSLGYFGYANYSLFSLLGRKVNLSGYPAGSNNPENKPFGYQWWHARVIKFVTSRRLIYNIDTQGGQSGSPVWRLINGKRYAVGIHTNGSTAGNSATRIVKPVFNNIKKWKNMYT